VVTINGSTTIALPGDIVELPTVPSPQVPASCEGSAKAVAGARFNRDLQVLGRELASGARGREFEPPAPTKQTNKLAFEPQALRGERYAVGSISMCVRAAPQAHRRKRGGANDWPPQVQRMTAKWPPLWGASPGIRYRSGRSRTRTASMPVKGAARKRCIDPAETRARGGKIGADGRVRRWPVHVRPKRSCLHLRQVAQLGKSWGDDPITRSTRTSRAPRLQPRR